MAGPWSSLAGLQVVAGSVMIPWYGAWVAEISVAVTTAVPTTMVPLVIGDLTLQGTVYRQAAYAGARTALVVGGHGGWIKQVQARAYRLAGGVPLSMILGDVCTDCGETIGAATTAAIAGQTVGPFFVREAAEASRTLSQLDLALWWVDSTGATQTTPRTTTTYAGSTTDLAHIGPVTSHFDVLDWQGATGKFQIGTEVMSDWMPGRTFTNANVPTAQTVSLVTLDIQGSGSARVEILATP
jgi:hypothetical protein